MTDDHSAERASESPERPLCGEPHPDYPDVICDRERPCYGSHMSVAARLVWDGPAHPGQQRSDPGLLRSMVEQIRGHRREEDHGH